MTAPASRRNLLGLTLCFLGIGSWAHSVAGFSLTSLSVSHGPMLNLPFTYWLSLILVLTAAFFVQRPLSRAICLISILVITTYTLALIEPFGRLHDSAWNVLFSAQVYSAGSLQAIEHPYAFSFPGSFMFFGALLSVTGLPTFVFLRLFIIIWSSVIFLGVFVLVRKIGRTVLNVHSTHFEYFATLFAITFGSHFFVRLNPAPEAVSYVVSIFALFLALSRGSKAVGLLILCIMVIVISHPLTPLLFLPSLLVFSLWRLDGGFPSLAVRRGVLVISLFVGWLVFRSNWIIQEALKVMVASVRYEVTMERGVLPPVHIAPLYYSFYGVTIAVISALVIISLYSNRKNNFGKGLGVVIILMVPWGLFLLGGELFSRFLMNTFIIAVLSIGWLGTKSVLSLDNRSRFSHNRAGIGPSLILILLISAMISSVASSYYADNAYDRITLVNYRAQEFMATTSVDGRIYADGFVVPLGWNITVLKSRRSFLVPSDVGLALISDHMRNFAILFEGKPYDGTRLYLIESSMNGSWTRVYDNGPSVLYNRFNVSET